MKNLIPDLCILCCLFIFSCEAPLQPYGNPPAVGFNQSASDEKAIAIADEVMVAMGGRKAWDETRYLSWDFFGERQLLWDKKSNRVRIKSEKDKYELILNMDDDYGILKLNGKFQNHRDSLSKYFKKGKEVWINDSYWLVMPFKLKDSGVTLKYLREDTTEAGSLSDVLQLTFENVGVTPQNKYEVYVDKESKLVTEWAFFSAATDSIPRFKTPWKNYEKHGNILLSEVRSDKYSMKPVRVYDKVPDEVFTSLVPVDFDSIN